LVIKERKPYILSRKYTPPPVILKISPLAHIIAGHYIVCLLLRDNKTVSHQLWVVQSHLYQTEQNSRAVRVPRFHPVVKFTKEFN